MPQGGIANVVTRTDGKFGWQLKANNGQIIAGDQGQGYEKESMARSMMVSILSGGYAHALEDTEVEVDPDDILLGTVHPEKEGDNP